jgi:Lar family restriction alleviation protein
MMSVELKPCPFCGSKDVEIMVDVYHFACCHECGIITTGYGNKEYAVKAWNTRVSPWHKYPDDPPKKEGWYETVLPDSNAKIEVHYYHFPSCINHDWQSMCARLYPTHWRELPELPKEGE